ncbi:MAG: hypothetical protein R3B72_48900 [Polyangiaceae bacterium]
MSKPWMILSTALLVLAGCGEDETTSPKPKPPRAAARFDADAGSGVTLEVERLDDEWLVLDVVRPDEVPIAGVALRLTSAPPSLALDHVEVAGGWPSPRVLGQQATSGLSLAAIAVEGEATSTTRRLARLHFRRVTPEGARVDFVASRSAVFGSDATPLEGVSWAGGELVVP